MRIAFIHPRYPSADGTGATYSATQIVRGLSNSGHQVSVYCTQKPKEKFGNQLVDMRYLTGNSVHPHTPSRLNKEVSARIDEFAEYDIVHSYLMGLIPALGKIGRETSTKTIVSLNAYGGVCAKNDLLYKDKIQCDSKSTVKCLNCIGQSGVNTETSYLYQTISQTLSLRLINRGERMREYIDGYQALTVHVKNTYAQFGYDQNKIKTIPNILDEKFDVEHKSNFTDPISILYVGSLKRTKGADRLPEVLSALNEHSNRFELTIVGTGELSQSIAQECRSRNLTNVVEIIGQVSNEDLPAIYSNHDIFLYPGRWDEPFGRIFLEAMATGTPIVTTDIGSVREIIGDAGVVTNGGINGLVEGVVSIAETDKLKGYSKRGKERAYRYKMNSIIPLFEDLYECGEKNNI